MTNGIKIVDRKLIDELRDQAGANPRLRQHHNLHDDFEEPFQRLINVMEPGSYLRPHRHLVYPKPESFVGLQGKLALITFDNDGAVEKVFKFGPQQDILCIDLPVGVWHTVVALEAGSVLYEAKPGPYVPVSPDDVASWSPAPDSHEAELYLANLTALV